MIQLVICIVNSHPHLTSKGIKVHLTQIFCSPGSKVNFFHNKFYRLRHFVWPKHFDLLNQRKMYLNAEFLFGISYSDKH